MLFFFLLTSLINSRRLESIVQKYKDQLQKDRTVEKEEEAILWALSEFAQQLDKTVTGEEVNKEIGDKINSILERVDIADAVLRKDFNEMKFEFAQAKQQISNLVQSSKAQILSEMDNFKAKLTEALRQLVQADQQVKTHAHSNVGQAAQQVVLKLRNTAIRRSVIFFCVFQILLVFGVIFYKKLEAQLRMLL